jgi:hypothetical protein
MSKRLTASILDLFELVDKRANRTLGFCAPDAIQGGRNGVGSQTNIPALKRVFYCEAF